MSGRLAILAMTSVLVGLLAMAFTVWMLIDVARRSEEEFAELGHQRTLWLVLLAVGAIAQFGVIVAIAYFVAVRSRLAATRTTP